MGYCKLYIIIMLYSYTCVYIYLDMGWILFDFVGGTGQNHYILLGGFKPIFVSFCLVGWLYISIDWPTCKTHAKLRPKAGLLGEFLSIHAFCNNWHPMRCHAVSKNSYLFSGLCGLTRAVSQAPTANQQTRGLGWKWVSQISHDLVHHQRPVLRHLKWMQRALLICDMSYYLI